MYAGGYGRYPVYMPGWVWGYPVYMPGWVWWVYTYLGIPPTTTLWVYHTLPPYPAHARRYPVV